MRHCKITVLAYVLVIAAFFSACSGTVNEDVLRSWYKDVVRMDASCAVTLDYGDSAADFTFSMVCDDNASKFTVIEPAEQAGLSVLVSQDGLTVTYNGAVFETGASARSGYSAFELLADQYKCLRGGFISAKGTERLNGMDCYVLYINTRLDKTGIMHKLWIYQANMQLARGETYCDGELLLSADYQQCTFTKK